MSKMTNFEIELEKQIDAYVENGWFKLEYGSFGNTAKEVKQGARTIVKWALDELSKDHAEIISAKDAEIKSLEIKLRICNDRSLRTYDGLTDKADRSDALEAENAKLKAQLKEHEDKGLTVYGRKVEVLRGTVDALEAENATLKVKLEKARECYWDEIERNGSSDWIAQADTEDEHEAAVEKYVVDNFDAELAQISVVENKVGSRDICEKCELFHRDCKCAY